MYLFHSFILLAVQYTIIYQSGWARLCYDNKQHQNLSGFTLQVYLLCLWSLLSSLKAQCSSCLSCNSPSQCMFLQLLHQKREWGISHGLWTYFSDFRESHQLAQTQRSKEEYSFHALRRRRGQEILVSTSNIYYIYQWINIIYLSNPYRWIFRLLLGFFPKELFSHLFLHTWVNISIV